MNYSETLEYLQSLVPKEFRMELEPLAKVCARFDNPQNKLKAIHICGTNGKGSTAAFCTSILQASGFRVGLFTSPHLQTVRERVQINRDMIAPEQLVAYTEKICAKLESPDELSFFEFMTLLSFLYFSEQKVEIAIYEVGLGGRLDATNLITPLVTIMTPIAYDHEQHLGSTLEEIATEKCGIMKAGVPMVLAAQEPEVEDVVQAFAEQLSCKLVYASPGNIRQPLGLLGDHQKQNAACAVEALKLLGEHGFTPLRAEIGLAKAGWPGRLERVQMYPSVIFDGAHNPHGMLSLTKYLKQHWPQNNVVLVFGAMRDKNVAEMLAELLPHVREVHCVGIPGHSERAAKPEELAAMAEKLGVKAQVWQQDPKEVFHQLKAKLEMNDLLLITGSLYLIGHMRDAYFQLEKV